MEDRPQHAHGRVRTVAAAVVLAPVAGHRCSGAGVLGLEKEVRGWGTEPDEIEPYLPPGARFEALEGVGHFVHIEQPRAVADLVLEFLS